MGGVKHTLQGLKEEEVSKSNNHMELTGWASQETSCTEGLRGAMLMVLDDQRMIEC